VERKGLDIHVLFTQMQKICRKISYHAQAVAARRALAVDTIFKRREGIEELQALTERPRACTG
jgi:hypothetical protein